MSRENQAVEWKESWRDDYLRYVCGFANAGGGLLVIGKNDSGKVVGVSDAARLLEELPNKIRDLLGIIVDVNLLIQEGEDILEIDVPSYPNPISYRGRYYHRSGSTLQEMKGAALDRFLLQRHGRTWDSVPLPGLKVSALSPVTIAKFREQAAASGRLSPADLAASDAGMLEKLKLTEGDYLKRAAVLLFHETPDRFITGAFVKIGFFVSESELGYHDEIHGPLFTQANTVIDLLRSKYMKAAIDYQGIQRIERFPVPYEALREAVLNALVHRDYAVPAPIQIRVYEDKMRIWNPAILPEGWNLEKLLGLHASHPYNPDVANAFFRSGEIESWGRGIERIFSACRESGMPPPVIRLEGHDLWMEFPFSRQYLAAIASSTPPSRRSSEESGSPHGLVDGLVDGLVENQREILRIVKSNPQVSKREMAKTLAISTTAIDKNIEILKRKGLLRRIGPAKGGRWEAFE